MSSNSDLNNLILPLYISVIILIGTYIEMYNKQKNKVSLTENLKGILILVVPFILIFLNLYVKLPFISWIILFVQFCIFRLVTAFITILN